MGKTASGGRFREVNPALDLFNLPSKFEVQTFRPKPPFRVIIAGAYFPREDYIPYNTSKDKCAPEPTFLNQNIGGLGGPRSIPNIYYKWQFRLFGRTWLPNFTTEVFPESPNGCFYNKTFPLDRICQGRCPTFQTRRGAPCPTFPMQMGPRETLTLKGLI